jgi:phosphatidylserine decarboxylase
MDLIQDEEVRLMKLKELHRYFVKNERVLIHELNQLRLG